MSTIVIVDYGMANLRSVQKAFERVGHAATISSEPEVIANADRVVLPGVGAFRDAIAKIREARLDEPISDHIFNGYPFLGICLGLQLLFTKSHEDGVYAGMDIVPGDVVKFGDHPGLKVPHMGWNNLAFNPKCPIFKGLEQGVSTYFVHSYYVQPQNEELVAATADYPGPFCAAIWRDNVVATQFHPEKSQTIGLQMLKNFAEWK